MKYIGKPCAGEPHARFDEGGQARGCPLLSPRSAFLAGFLSQSWPADSADEAFEKGCAPIVIRI